MSSIDVKIFVDNQLIDLPDDKRELNIKLNREFLDLQSPERRSGDYSYTVKFPKTKRNNEIFGSIQPTNVHNKYYKQEDYEIKMYINGVDITVGVFKLRNVSEKYYEGNILSSGISWAKELSKKKLSEITNADGTPWTFEFIGSSATADEYSLQWYCNNTNYDNADIAFPLISRGTFYNELYIDEANWIGEESLSMTDIPPSPYHLKVIKKIFEGIGWYVDSSLFYNEQHKNLVIPFTSADEYQWNYGRLINSASQHSGYQNYDSGLINGSFLTAKMDRYRWETVPDKRAVSLRYFYPDTIITDSLDRFDYYTYTPTSGGTKTGITFNTPITAKYSGYLKIDNFAFACNGILDEENGVLSDYTTNTLSGYSNVKLGIIFYIENLNQSLSSTYEIDMLDDFMNYTWYGEELSYSNIIGFFDIINSTSSSSYFSQIYDRDANITVDYDRNYFNFVPAISDGDAWSITITGGTFQLNFTDLMIPSGFRLKWGIISPAYNNYATGSTLYFRDFIQYYMDTTGVTWCFTSNTNSDYSVDIGKNLGDQNQLDFVKDWMVQNNLFITTTPENKTVRFDTYDDFFLSNDSAIDLTSKVDLNNNEPPSKPVNLPKQVKFEYKNDGSDALLMNDMDYGSQLIVSDNIYQENEKNITRIFSSTKMRDFKLFIERYSFPGQASTNYPITLPSIANEADYTNADLQSVQWTFSAYPRILKLNGNLQVLITGSTTYQEVPVKVDGINTYLKASLFQDTRDGYLNLDFEGDNGLYTTFYERYMNEIGNSNIINVNALINAYDYRRLTPQTPIIIDTVPYFLNSIKSFDPIDDGMSPTKIELIRKFTN